MKLSAILSLEESQPTFRQRCGDKGSRKDGRGSEIAVCDARHVELEGNVKMKIRKGDLPSRKCQSRLLVLYKLTSLASVCGVSGLCTEGEIERRPPSRVLYQSHDYYRALRIVDSMICNPIERQSFLHDEWAMRFAAPDIHESGSSNGP